MKYTLFPAFAAMTFAASGSHADSQTAPQVTEIVTFYLNEGVDVADFLAATRRTEVFLRTTGHVLSRTVSRDENGLWTDFIVWRDQKTAEATAQAAMQSADFAPFMSMISTREMSMRYGCITYQMD